MAWNQTVAGMQRSVQLLEDNDPAALDTQTTPEACDVLPEQDDPNYYTEHVVPDPSKPNHAGSYRIVTGKGGEVYFTWGHYRPNTWVRIK
jgi:guanyl-specific ribonuclease Sa